MMNAKRNTLGIPNEAGSLSEMLASLLSKLIVSNSAIDLYSLGCESSSITCDHDAGTVSKKQFLCM
jgi:hypothetical protein